MEFEKNYLINVEVFVTENVRRVSKDICLSVSRPLKGVTDTKEYGNYHKLRPNSVQIFLYI